MTREQLVRIVRQQAEHVAALEGQVADYAVRLVKLEAELDLLRSQSQGKGPGNGLPPFIKPNRPKRAKGERKERKKRPQAFVRRREPATAEVTHSLEVCPDCGHKLSGGWEKTRRQVIELPEEPVRVTDHVMMACRCGHCGKTHVAKLGPEVGVLGQHRVGIRLMSTVATLSGEYRLPQAGIQQLLKSTYQAGFSVGEISEILHSVAKAGAGLVAEALEAVRTAPYVHADETGWREDGLNGYLWSFSTPNERYFFRSPSRSGEVPKAILGEDFLGILLADFYYGYNWFMGRVQRCWVHFCRDLAALRDSDGQDASVKAWVNKVLDVYRRAKAAVTQVWQQPEAQRREARCRFQAELLALAKPYAHVVEAPQRVLAERIVNFEDQLFTFVQHPGTPSENNPAERAVRPAVIARKISGGTRSEKGSATKSALLTLFGTWKLRGQDQLQACTEMLRQASASARAAPG